MSDWHDGSLRYEGCKGCRYADVCESGCRMASLGFTGSLKEKDPLYVGPHAFTKHYELDGFKELEEKLDAGEKMRAPKRLKFRDEEDFVLLNIRWGNTISIPTDLGEKIKGFQSLGTLLLWQISTTLIVIWLLALFSKTPWKRQIMKSLITERMLV